MSIQLLVRRYPLLSVRRRTFSTTVILRASISEHFPSLGFDVFSESFEREIRNRLDILPNGGNIFQNYDGTPRIPKEAEVEELKQISVLARQRQISVTDIMKLNDEQRHLISKNGKDLQKYVNCGALKVLDYKPAIADGTSSAPEIPYNSTISWKESDINKRKRWQSMPFFLALAACLTFFGSSYLKKTTIDKNRENEIKDDN